MCYSRNVRTTPQTNEGRHHRGQGLEVGVCDVISRKEQNARDLYRTKRRGWLGRATDMSGPSKEVKYVIDRARAQGLIVEIDAGTGHWRYTNPETGDWRFGPATPGNGGRAIKILEAKLAQIGYKKVRPPKPKRKSRRNKQEEVKVDMAKFGEIARVTPGVTVPEFIEPLVTDPLMKWEEILMEDNLPVAAEWVYDLIMEQIRNGTTRAVAYRAPDGVAGYRWEGSRDAAITRRWPTMPNARRRKLDNATGTDVVVNALPNRERQALGAYLTRSRHMWCLLRGNPHRKSVWWIRSEWDTNAPPASIIGSNKTAAGSWWTDILGGADMSGVDDTVTVSYACRHCQDHYDNADERAVHEQFKHFRCPECGETAVNARFLGLHRSQKHAVRAPSYEQNRNLRLRKAGLTVIEADAKGYFQCPDCAVCSTTSAVVTRHRMYYQDIEETHPSETFGCAIPGCREVRDTGASLAGHYQKTHGDLGLVICHQCGQPFETKGAQAAHSSVHRQAARQRETFEDVEHTGSVSQFTMSEVDYDLEEVEDIETIQMELDELDEVSDDELTSMTSGVQSPMRTTMPAPTTIDPLEADSVDAIVRLVSRYQALTLREEQHEGVVRRLKERIEELIAENEALVRKNEKLQKTVNGFSALLSSIQED